MSLAALPLSSHHLPSTGRVGAWRALTCLLMLGIALQSFLLPGLRIADRSHYHASASVKPGQMHLQFRELTEANHDDEVIDVLRASRHRAVPHAPIVLHDNHHAGERASSHPHPHPHAHDQTAPAHSDGADVGASTPAAADVHASHASPATHRHDAGDADVVYVAGTGEEVHSSSPFKRVALDVESVVLRAAVAAVVLPARQLFTEGASSFRSHRELPLERPPRARA